MNHRYEHGYENIEKKNDKTCEEKDELETINIYDDFVETNELVNDLIEKVIEVGDLHTLVEIEHLLDEREEYARQRDVTKKINEIVEESEAFHVVDGDDDGG